MIQGSEAGLWLQDSEPLTVGMVGDLDGRRRKKKRDEQESRGKKERKNEETKRRGEGEEERFGEREVTPKHNREAILKLQSWMIAVSAGLDDFLLISSQFRPWKRDVQTL